MNVLTAMWLDDISMTAKAPTWAGYRTSREFFEERELPRNGEVVRIEDVPFPDGQMHGNRSIIERVYFWDTEVAPGVQRRTTFNTRRGYYLEPLPKNPLTLEDAEVLLGGREDVPR